MKNLKLAKRLLLSFSIVGLILIVAVVFSITGLQEINKRVERYNAAFQKNDDIGDMRVSLNAGKSLMLQAATVTEKEKIQTCIDSAAQEMQKVVGLLDSLRDDLQSAEEKTLADQLDTLLSTGAASRAEAGRLLVAGDREALSVLNNDYVPMVDSFFSYLQKLDDISTAAAADALRILHDVRVTLSFGLVALAVVTVSTVIIAAWRTTYGIVQPLRELKDAAARMAEGDLSVQIDYSAGSEIGELAERMREMVTTLSSYVSNISAVLGSMAEGDMTTQVEMDYLGDFLPIKLAMQKINASLNNTLSQINLSADQVATGAEQVSAGAQALSQGATEQASSIEELAATIADVSTQVRANASDAEEASNRVAGVGAEVGESNRQMGDMINAMDDIRRTSAQISAIIKTIEDIAFQTNILALNAAVEAARAGSAGKGFSVVAGEVRNLANKSGEAAKNTTQLIQNSLDAVENGVKLSKVTAEALQSAAEDAKKVSGLVGRISEACHTQAESIEQVTIGFDQISSVVQTNSATAEQSAASSEQLSGQAQMLKRLVSNFRLNGGSYPAPIMPGDGGAAGWDDGVTDAGSKYL